MMFGFAARGQDKRRMCPKCVGQRRQVSLSCGRKTGLYSSFFRYNPIPYNPIRTKPKGRVAVVQMSPDWGDSVFRGMFQ